MNRTRILANIARKGNLHGCCRGGAVSCLAWMDVRAAHHVVGSDGRPLITEEVYLKVTLLGDVVSWKMWRLIPDDTLWLDGFFDRSRLECGDPHLFLKGEIKEAQRSAAGDLLANRLG